MEPLGAGDIGSYEYNANKRALDCLTVRHACPKGVYVTALPHQSNEWEGVLFARQGPYSPAVLRFQITFPNEFPRRPPLIVFSSEVFHPLVSPSTTYTFTDQDTDEDTFSASDQNRLPPGAFSLRHGFPTCYTQNSWPHIAVILFYLRAAFTSETLLDSVPQESAANSAAWHAWRAFRSKATGRTGSVSSKPDARLSAVDAVKQSPGGARSPGEWNWTGVWEDRLRKSIRGSTSEQAIFKQPGLSEDTIQFADIDQESLSKLVPWTSQLLRSAYIYDDSNEPQ